MAYLKLNLVTLFIIYYSAVIPERKTTQFPVNDCSKNEMDILSLCYASYNPHEVSYQNNLQSFFIYNVNNLLYNNTATRVVHFNVFDYYSTRNVDVDISSWTFQESIGGEIGESSGWQNAMTSLTFLEHVLQQKVEFVLRLFSELTGVRETATHLAVIYLDGGFMSVGDSLQISGITTRVLESQQQHETAVKIFIVIIGIQGVREAMYLSDTLLIPDDHSFTWINVLFLAMCRECMEGWFALEHSHSADSLSCYRLVDNPSYKINWIEATNLCYANYSHLATIDTSEQLHVLQTWLHRNVKEHLNQENDWDASSPLLVQVYIGLVRDVKSVAKRFYWSLDQGTRYRPLVVNNWLRGEPSGGYTSGCVVWQFLWSDHNNGINVSSKDGHFRDGWGDVGCWTKLNALTLCEMAFPRRLEETNLLTISRAGNESFSKALGKRGFTKHGDNIVSVAAYATNRKSEQVVKETEDEFPVFDCGEDTTYPRYISYLYVCDNKDHCSNRRDESSCKSDSSDETNTENEHFSTRECEGIFCCDGSCLPEQYINDGQIDCAICEFGTENIVNDETLILNKYLTRNETCAFICGDDKCVHVSELNNGHDDCDGGEGPLDETIGKLETANTCYNILGHSIWAPRCVYVKDRYGGVLGCRDMSHLNDCAAFECPEGYFKCPNAYCIPQHYVLDEKVDCPTEEDEQLLNIGSCSGNFACWNSHICLHPDLVCDSHAECPHQDDEDCYTRCPIGLRCVSGTITVSDYNVYIPLGELISSDSRTRYVDLSGVDASIGWNRLPFMFQNVLFIMLSNCQISKVSDMLSLVNSNILKMDASYNLIQAFRGNEYQYHNFKYIRHLNLSHNRELILVENVKFRFLETIDLSHTGLSYLDKGLLIGWPNLKHLNLSCTFIVDYHQNVFPSRFTLQTLDLRGTSMNDFKKPSFIGLTISQHLYTDNFEICCPQIRGTNIPYYTCHSHEGAISSCFDLIGANVQRVLLWLVAALAVLGNTTVIGYRVIWERSVLRTGYGLFVTHLGISDFIMGVYLFIIAGADYYYRGSYVLYDKHWRESIVCRMSGFLSTISIETGTFFCFLITVDRFLVMKFPFGQKRLSKINKTIAVLFSWIFGFLIALIPVVFGFQIYSSNAMCVGLPLARQRSIGWAYSSGVFIVLNGVMFLVIAGGQIAIFRAMSANRIDRSASSSTNNRPEDILVAKQLSLVALSNFLCWSPLVITGLMSFVVNEISNDVYSWITVLILPMNCAANPVLYTIPALMAKWETFKQGRIRQRAYLT